MTSVQSYTGVEILRVLVKNKAGPILMIAFTNHALDHLLCSVLDAGITQNVVRLGSRSADERISRFSIEAMEEVAGRSRLDRAFAKHHKQLKEVEEEIKKLMQDCLRTSIDTSHILRHLEVAYPVHFQSLSELPLWISILYKAENASENNEDAWTRVGKGGRNAVTDGTTYAYWAAASDLHFLEGAHIQARSDRDASRNDQGTHDESMPVATSATNQFAVLENSGEGESNDSSEMGSVTSIDIDFEDDILPEEEWMFAPDQVNPPPTKVSRVPTDEQMHSEPEPSDVISGPSPRTLPSAASGGIQASDFHDIRDFFEYFGHAEIPPISVQNRPLDDLLEVEDIWELSYSERVRLHTHWTTEVRTALQEQRIMEFQRLRKRHADALQRYNEGKAEVSVYGELHE